MGSETTPGKGMLIQDLKLKQLAQRIKD
jgi:hypothetical protein